MKRSKLIYVVGSITLGVIALLCVLFSLIGTGVINATQTKLVFASKSANFVYDGKVHQNYEWQLSDGTLKKGHKAKVTVTGRQLDVGESENFISAVILDSNGADVTIYYEIEYKVGKLKVAPRPLSITSGSKSKIYDGTPLIYTDEDQAFKISDGELVSGHRVEVAYTNNITNAGKVSNTVGVHVYDSRGADKTSNYALTIITGILEVEKKPITIQSTDATKVYDGTPLTKNDYTFDRTQLIEGHTEEIEVIGSAVEVGQYYNVFNAKIFDANGQDVSTNYEISQERGILTIAPIPLTITTSGATKQYDAQPLTKEEYKSEGSLLENHTLTVTITGTCTEVGYSANEFKFAIADADGNDVSKLYDVTQIYGRLTIIPREVALLSFELAKIYDGTPLTKIGSYTQWNEVVMIYSGSFLEGHYPVVEMTGSRTDVGVSQNTYVVNEILDAEGNDVFGCYKIEKNTNLLKVFERRVTVKSSSYSWVYDGLEHYYKDWETYPTPPPTSSSEEGELLQSPMTQSFVFGDAMEFYGGAEGHKIYIEMPTKVTNVNDSGDNIIGEITVYDREGQDVTTNYKLEKVLGRLTITPRPLSIRAGSAKKVFDGEKLTCATYEIIGSPAKTGGEAHIVNAKTSGERTIVGESSNKIVLYSITDNEGNDYTENYFVTTADGALIVYDPTNPPTKEGGGLDDSGSLKGNGDDGSDRIAVKIKSERSGEVYLRYKSFGDFDKQSWSSATDYGRDVLGYGANYMAGVALSNAGYRSYKMSIEVVNGNNYLLPYYHENNTAGGLNFAQSSDTTYAGSTEFLYSCFYYQYNYVKDGQINNPYLGDFAEFEIAYRKFVRDNYLYVDDETAEFLQNIINIKDFKLSDPQIISKVASYIQSAATYNLDYNDSLDTSPNVVISFLRDIKEGVCRHYATAATLLFRKLGIPARYVIGYVGASRAGQEVSIKAKNAHAWVEVYLDGFGWTYVEVTGGGPGGGGSGGSGSGGGSNIKGTVIKPVNQYYKYDGKLHSHDGTLQGLTTFISRGYTFNATVEGTPRSITGKSEYRIATFAAYYGGIDVTEQFITDNNIVLGTGILQVYKYEITITTRDETKKYDGQPLTNDNVTWTGLQSGHTVARCVTISSIDKVGAILNMCAIRIEDSLGNNITDEYKIVENYGVLTITPPEITIIAKDAQKTYDGTPLTNNGENSYTISGDNLVEGHKAVVKIIGSQTRIGSSPNKIVSVVIYDAVGVDVTANYLVHTQNGTLTVTKPTRPTT